MTEKERQSIRRPGSERRARWMESAQRGDRDAYRALLEDIAPELGAFLRRRVRDESDAEDLVQEVLLAVHRARHTFDPSRPFDPWMYAIARNALTDHLRRNAARARWETAPGDLPDGVAEAGPSLGRAHLEQALEGLPESQREAFRMLKIEGLSVEAAAARAGVSPGALRVRAHRAYQALRARLRGGR